MTTGARGTDRQALGRGLSIIPGLLRTGTGAMLVLSIMAIGSLVLWLGTPLLWLWVGGQVQGNTQSLGSALAVALVGVIITVIALASLLSRLSDIYRGNCRARGLGDPGHAVLEGVLVISAGLTMSVFGVWFLFFAGAAPAPIGLQL